MSVRMKLYQSLCFIGVVLSLGFTFSWRDPSNVRISAIERRDAPTIVYNLSVAHTENYFVTSRSILVHNCLSPIDTADLKRIGGGGQHEVFELVPGESVLRVPHRSEEYADILAAYRDLSRQQIGGRFVAPQIIEEVPVRHVTGRKGYIVEHGGVPLKEVANPELTKQAVEIGLELERRGFWDLLVEIPDGGILPKYSQFTVRDGQVMVVDVTKTISIPVWGQAEKSTTVLLDRSLGTTTPLKRP